MAEKAGDSPAGTPGTTGTPSEGMRTLKRQRGTPTFQTPHRPRKRAPLREISEGEPPIRCLSFAVTVAGHQTPGSGSDGELKGLVVFGLFHSTGERWPTHKQEAFWKSAGEFVRKRAITSHVRSGQLF